MLVAAGGLLLAQSRTFQFFIRVTDAAGKPVVELSAGDVAFEESGVRQKIARVERLPVPVKVTIAVDNSADSAAAIAHYRSGLAGLVEALPPDVEVSLITTTPQPRTVLRPTADRGVILKGIGGFGSEPGAPRFSDTIVEFSRRLRDESKDKRIGPYRPVLIMLSTTAVEQGSYETPEINQAIEFLTARRAKLYVAMLSTRTGQAASPETINASLQAVIALPLVKSSEGRYEPLAASARLVTLLPEWAKELAELHARQIDQFRVTVERATDGPLQTPRAGMARLDLRGTVTLDGYLP